VVCLLLYIWQRAALFTSIGKQFFLNVYL